VIGGVVLAAGSGSRFGGLKQVADFRGHPLIEYSLEAMAAVPAIDRIVVVLGAGAEEIRAKARLDGAEVVVADRWREGIAASLRAGIDALRDADAALVTLADQPLITPGVIATVADLGDSRLPAARATYGGHVGHPVLIKRELFDAVAGLTGDRGARDLLEGAGVAKVECGHLASAADVDTPADLEAISELSGSARP
jgi:molybdenum cofactor cytidylyltransferase